MSRVQNKPHVETPSPPEFEAAAKNNVAQANEEFQPVAQTEEPRSNNTERENYCSHEGIDRCRNGAGLVGGLTEGVTATVGEVIDIVDDDGERKQGTVVDEDDDSYTVTYDSDGDGKHDRTCKRDKDSGHCWGWRKASKEELEMAAAQQLMQQANEINAQRIEDNMKTNNTRRARRLEDLKKEHLQEDLEQTELNKIQRAAPDVQKVDYDSLKIRFQSSAPDNEFDSVSVSEIILAQNSTEASKR